jgi:uncharacterized protein YdcH (DUF465 family)
MRNAQENLRLSSGQLNKVQNEFRSVCNENDELKKRINDMETNMKKYGNDTNSKLQSLSL